MSERKRPAPEHEAGTRAARSDRPAEGGPRKGDRVSWRSHGGSAHGTVEREITERTKAAKRTVAASRDDPQYLVRTDEGREAVHRPEALHPDER
nr:DUF2945 domain-containing protein [Micromonospora sp. DSM 115978]